MPKSAWYQSLLNNQLHELIGGLKTDPFKNVHVISSALITSTGPMDHYYTLAFKPKIMKPRERKLHINDNSAYCRFLDDLHEQYTTGKIGPRGYNNLIEDWMNDNDVPSIGYNVILQTSASNIEDLPFTAKDIQDVATAIKKYSGLVPEGLWLNDNHLNVTGYQLTTNDNTDNQECSWVKSNQNWWEVV